jgi:hypothetical protein
LSAVQAALAAGITWVEAEGWWPYTTTATRRGRSSATRAAVPAGSSPSAAASRTATEWPWPRTKLAMSPAQTGFSTAASSVASD